MTIICFADALPIEFRGTRIVGIFAITWASYSMKSIGQSYNSFNNFNVTIPLTDHATVSLAGFSSSLVFQYIVLCLKFILNTFRKADELVILRAPLKLHKMLDNQANFILRTAEEQKIFDELGDLGQKLVIAVVGHASDEPWEIYSKRSDCTISSRRMPTKHAGMKILNAWKLVLHLLFTLYNYFICICNILFIYISLLFLNFFS